MIKTANRGSPRPQIARFSNLLIGAGLVIFMLALTHGALSFLQFNSPFDRVDSSPVYEVGFLPVLSSEEAVSPGVSLASPPRVEFYSQHPVVANDSLLARRSPQNQAVNPALSPGSGAGAGLNPDITSRAGSLEAGVESANIPDRIVIPSIGLDGPIVPVGLIEIEYKLQTFQQWSAPDFFAAGWHSTSSTPGKVGNTVLNGHHNAFGEIFKDLAELEIGDLIYVYSGDQVFTYKVGLNTRFDERFRPVEERLENARWIMPSQDERLTIITCWPYESNTHRVVVVAIPVRDHSGITQ
jgi:LPXTG-site transpeptidase (sortase) family protein